MDIFNLGPWALGCFAATWLMATVGMIVVWGRYTTVDRSDD